MRGVPQGSKLGPLLFNFYTADLPHAVPSVCSIILYADDACIYTSDNSLDGVVKHLQEGVNSTANWYRENLMSLKREISTGFVALSIGEIREGFLAVLKAEIRTGYLQAFFFQPKK